MILSLRIRNIQSAEQASDIYNAIEKLVTEMDPLALTDTLFIPECAIIEVGDSFDQITKEEANDATDTEG